MKKKKKKPLYVVYSDIHHNIWNQFNENDRRVYISMDAEIAIFNVAKGLNVPVLFNGDIIHTEKYISNKLLSYILPHYKKLEKLGVTMMAITGNHDQSETNTKDNQSPSYIQTFSQIFDYIKCMDFKMIMDRDNKVLVMGIPYLTHDVGLLDHLKSQRIYLKDKSYKKILMLHTTLPKTRDTDGRLIQTNTIGNDVMEFIDKYFDLVLTGHIHKPMMLGDKIVQVGATNQQRKTDKDCKLGYWIIYSDMSAEFIRMNTPRFVELEYGEKKPDKGNFYYNKLKDSGITQKDYVTQAEGNFNDVTNKRKLARSYLKEKGIKDKVKKSTLITLLKDPE